MFVPREQVQVQFSMLAFVSTQLCALWTSILDPHDIPSVMQASDLTGVDERDCTYTRDARGAVIPHWRSPSRRVLLFPRGWNKLLR